MYHGKRITFAFAGSGHGVKAVRVDGREHPADQPIAACDVRDGIRIEGQVR